MLMWSLLCQHVVVVPECIKDTLLGCCCQQTCATDLRQGLQKHTQHTVAQSTPRFVKQTSTHDVFYKPCAAESASFKKQVKMPSNFQVCEGCRYMYSLHALMHHSQQVQLPWQTWKPCSTIQVLPLVKCYLHSPSGWPTQGQPARVWTHTCRLSKTKYRHTFVCWWAMFETKP